MNYGKLVHFICTVSFMFGSAFFTYLATGKLSAGGAVLFGLWAMAGFIENGSRD